MSRYFKLMIALLVLTPHMVSAERTFTVIIDPGHGGKDRGAVYFGYTEAKINLQVANFLAAELQNDSRFSYAITRTTDVEMDLEQRAKLAEAKKGDIFISIHTNAFNKANARGAELYFQNQLPPDEEAMFLAQQENLQFNSNEINHWPLEPVSNQQKYPGEVISILKDLQLSTRIKLSEKLAADLKSTWSKKPPADIKQAPFFVISNVPMPSVLVEMGYLSNPNEAKMLGSKKYQKEIATKIYSGIVRFKESMDKSPPASLN